MSAVRKPPSFYDRGESGWDAKAQAFDDWLREDRLAPIAREVLTPREAEERAHRGQTTEPDFT